MQTSDTNSGEPDINELSRQIVATVQSNASAILRENHLTSSTAHLRTSTVASPAPSNDTADHAHGRSSLLTGEHTRSDTPESLLDGPLSDLGLSPGAPHSPQDLAQSRSPPLMNAADDHIPGTPPQTRAHPENLHNPQAPPPGANFHSNDSQMPRPKSGSVVEHSLLDTGFADDSLRASSAACQRSLACDSQELMGPGSGVNDRAQAPPETQHNGFISEDTTLSTGGTMQPREVINDDSHVVDLLGGLVSSSGTITTTTVTTETHATADGVVTHTSQQQTTVQNRSNSSQSREEPQVKPSGIPVNSSPKKVKPTATIAPQLDMKAAQSLSPRTKKKPIKTSPNASPSTRRRVPPPSKKSPRPQTTAQKVPPLNLTATSLSTTNARPSPKSSPRDKSPRMASGPRGLREPGGPRGQRDASPRSIPRNTDARSRVSRRGDHCALYLLLFLL